MSSIEMNAFLSHYAGLREMMSLSPSAAASPLRLPFPTVLSPFSSSSFRQPLPTHSFHFSFVNLAYLIPPHFYSSPSRRLSPRLIPRISLRRPFPKPPVAYFSYFPPSPLRHPSPANSSYTSRPFPVSAIPRASSAIRPSPASDSHGRERHFNPP